MSETSIPDYEGMSIYAIGIPMAVRSQMREGVYDLQTVCKENGVRTFMADNLVTVGRNLGFTRDQTFLNAARGACQQPEDLHKLWRLHTYCWAISTALGVPGDLVECGVYEGLYAATAMGTIGDSIGTARNYYLYDTFHGLDERYATDFEIQLSGPTFAVGGIEESVRARFAKWPNVKVIAGTVPDVLHDTAPEQVAFLHLDMNCAGAEIAALEFFYDRVTNGGVILLDDYGRTEFVGLFEAYEAWFGAHDQRILELPTGQGMVVKRAHTA
ncbi:MAG: class I SAM-dependent methyltransferase [Alphaproteobacteria bacterium]|nr:class I SAM-dependent methyltransferase [Alphaproteobacteria bacterium]